MDIVLITIITEEYTFMKVLCIFWIILKSIIIGIILYPIGYAYCYLDGGSNDDNLWLVVLILDIIAVVIIALIEIFRYLKKVK